MRSTLAAIAAGLDEAGVPAPRGEVYSGEEALEAFANRPYEVLITDARLGGDLTGWEVARRIREKDRTFPVIYLTASAIGEWAREGVPDSILIGKPFMTAQLVTKLSSLLRAARERIE